MQLNAIVNAELLPEIWGGDDWCGEVVHNHFSKCPVCLFVGAGTDAYYELDNNDTEIECRECDTALVRVSSCWYSDLLLKPTHLEPKHLL